MLVNILTIAAGVFIGLLIEGFAMAGVAILMRRKADQIMKDEMEKFQAMIATNGTQAGTTNVVN